MFLKNTDAAITFAANVTHIRSVAGVRVQMKSQVLFALETALAVWTDKWPGHRFGSMMIKRRPVIIGLVDWTEQWAGHDKFGAFPHFFRFWRLWRRLIVEEGMLKRLNRRWWWWPLLLLHLFNRRLNRQLWWCCFWCWEWCFGQLSYCLFFFPQQPIKLFLLLIALHSFSPLETRQVRKFMQLKSRHGAEFVGALATPKVIVNMMPCQDVSSKNRSPAKGRLAKRTAQEFMLEFDAMREFMRVQIGFDVERRRALVTGVRLSIWVGACVANGLF